jgi:hypothetical protein
VKCDVCDKEKELSYQSYNKNISKHGIYSCSEKCAQFKNRLTNKEKYGVDYPLQSTEIKNKMKNTNNERYGVDNVFQSEIIKQQIIKTNNINYGVDYPQQNKEILEKSNRTNLDKYGFTRPSKNVDVVKKMIRTNINRYGVKHPIQNNDIKNKILETNLIKYGVDNPTKSKEIKDKVSLTCRNKEKKSNKSIIEIDLDEREYLMKCDCGKEHLFTIPFSLYNSRKYFTNHYCTICFPPYQKSVSQCETDMLNFIKNNYTDEVIINSKSIISPYELDIYLPDLKLAFEFNGVFWHNELNKDKHYHKIKSNLCDSSGIQLVHIYEDDWIYKEPIVKSMILNKLERTSSKIFARKCIIKEINSKESVSFLNSNHLQGNVNSIIKIGLYYNNDLVSLMTFGKLRKSMNSKSKDGQYEMLRFCNKLNTNIVGGASKLFKYFTKTYNPSSIVSYADRSYSNGNLYKQLGFELKHITNPNYYYVVNNIRKHRFGFRKDILVKQGYDKNKSEHQIMLERKIYRIYNSGNMKFVYNL